MKGLKSARRRAEAVRTSSLSDRNSASSQDQDFVATEFTDAERIGALLRQSREDQGLSIADITERTRIRDIHLLALESGEVDKLPGTTFVAGFLRLYARTLHLPNLEVIEAFLEAWEPKKQKLQTELFPSPAIQRHRPSLGMAIGGVLALIACFFAYEHFSPNTLSDSPSTPETAPLRVRESPSANKHPTPETVVQEEKPVVAALASRDQFSTDGKLSVADKPPVEDKSAAEVKPSVADKPVAEVKLPVEEKSATGVRSLVEVAPLVGVKPLVETRLSIRDKPPAVGNEPFPKDKVPTKGKLSAEDKFLVKNKNNVKDQLPAEEIPSTESKSFMRSRFFTKKPPAWKEYPPLGDALVDSKPAVKDKPSVEKGAPQVAKPLKTEVALVPVELPKVKANIKSPTKLGANVPLTHEPTNHPPKTTQPAVLPLTSAPVRAEAEEVEPDWSKPSGPPAKSLPHPTPNLAKPVSPAPSGLAVNAELLKQEHPKRTARQTVREANPELLTQEEKKNSSKVVSLLAKEMVWVQIQDREGVVLKDMVMQPGHVFRVPEGEPFYAIIGNASSVQFRVGNQELPSLGKAGDVIQNLELSAPVLRQRATKR